LSVAEQIRDALVRQLVQDDAASGEPVGRMLGRRLDAWEQGRAPAMVAYEKARGPGSLRRDCRAAFVAARDGGSHG